MRYIAYTSESVELEPHFRRMAGLATLASFRVSFCWASEWQSESSDCCCCCFSCPALLDGRASNQCLKHSVRGRCCCCDRRDTNKATHLTKANPVGLPLLAVPRFFRVVHRCRARCWCHRTRQHFHPITAQSTPSQHSSPHKKKTARFPVFFYFPQRTCGF
ncbi:hypothetical protein K440DRAFT_2539 [Wilcoxina mikolae CBS 423.85]|nr:hypothetical protein K440DRAFT_2539 [Wilcoxina mikolae CBS 423.85]